MSFINSIYTPSISLFIAEPRSGKSYLIKYIMYNLAKKKKIKQGIVFCPTNDMNNNYDYIDSSYIFPIYKEEYLKKYLEVLKTNTSIPSFLIFDDCIGSVKWNSPLIEHLFSCYRHYNLTILVATQYIYKIPPVIRECATYAFIFYVSNVRSLNAIRDTLMVEMDAKQVSHFIEHSTCPKSEKDKGHFILVKKQVPLKEKYILSRAPTKQPTFKIQY